MVENNQNVYLVVINGERRGAVIVDGGPGGRCELCSWTDEVKVRVGTSGEPKEAIYCQRAGEMLDCRGIDLSRELKKAILVKPGLYMVINSDLSLEQMLRLQPVCVDYITPAGGLVYGPKVKRLSIKTE